MSDLAHVRGLIERKVRGILLGEADVRETTARVFARVLARVFWLADAPPDAHAAAELTPVAERELDGWLRDALTLRSLMADDTPPQPAMFRRRLHAVLARAHGMYDI